MNKLIDKLGLEEKSPVEIAYTYPTEYSLKKVPKIEQTYELAMYVCSHDGLALKHVSKKLLSKELCVTAIKQNGLALKYVSGIYFTMRLCEMAVLSNGRALEYVPDNEKTEELCEMAVSHYLNMPSRRLHETNEEYIDICEKHIEESKIHGCKLDVYQKYPISFVPSKFLTEQLLIKAIKYAPLSLRDVPYKYKNKGIVNLAVSLNGLSLQYVPANYYSKNMMSTALNENPFAIKFVPNRYINQDICNKLFEKEYSSFVYFPEEYVTLEMCLELVKLNIFCVNKQSKSKLLEIYGSTNIPYISFDDIPFQILNDRKFLNEVIKKDKYSAVCILVWNEEIIEKRLDERVNIWGFPQNRRGTEILPLKKDTINYLKKMNTRYSDYQKDETTLQVEKAKYYVNNLENFKVPLEPVSCNSLLVKYSDDADIVHNLANDEQADTIYYISDIHIERQLFEEAVRVFNQKSRMEKNRYIEWKTILIDLLGKKIEKMIAKKSGILLIGGDVAENTFLYEIFFKELANRWKGKIISVLGNHELWDGTTESDWTNTDYQARKVEEIIYDYKKILDKYYNCYLIENELLIKYKNDRYYVLSEKDILSATDDDIKDIVKKSSLIILGGIGFSGLNKYYNSTIGLYRKTITSLDEDKRRSKRFLNIYEKIERCAYEKQVIVLTHTPVHDWMDNEYNPNWIYINGHTHQNTLIKEKNGAVVLSDNQVGYEPREWKLNAFIPNCLWYDPFENYEDGIYKITSEEYKVFNRGRGINSNGCNYEGDLYALKRDNMYMFLLESATSLCLMVGGRRKRLEKSDIQYYYDNMLTYGQTVLNAIKPYKTVMKQLSNEVKKIGGIGTVHGCIVDISWFSHIYVNPFDGKITPYWALNTFSRFVYNDIRELIEAEELDLVNQLETEINRHALPLIENHLMTKESSSNLALVPKWVLGAEIYEPSRIMKAIQYIWEQNVIRIWDENILHKKDVDTKSIE